MALLTLPHYTNSQSSIISFGYVDFQAKIFPILYPPLENSTTRITITLGTYKPYIGRQIRIFYTTLFALNQTYVHTQYLLDIPANIGQKEIMTFKIQMLFHKSIEPTGCTNANLYTSFCSSRQKYASQIQVEGI